MFHEHDVALEVSPPVWQHEHVEWTEVVDVDQNGIKVGLEQYQEIAAANILQ